MATEQKPRATRERLLSPGVWLYSDGSKRRENGQTVELHPALRQHAITSESASNMHEARRQKRQETRARLRQAITQATNERAAIDSAGLLRELESAPEAVAYAGRLLWEQIVLNKQAPARDRRETFRDLTQEMDLLGRPAVDEGEGETVTVTIPRAVVAQLRDYLLARLSASDEPGGDSIDGEIIEGGES